MLHYLVRHKVADMCFGVGPDADRRRKYLI